MTVYQDLFEGGWAAVQMEFETDTPEPHQVLYAQYEVYSYEGEADVLWRNVDGTFGYVSGSHCSCYGLGGQFNPEVYTAEVLRGFAKRATGGFFKDQKDLILAATAPALPQ